LQCHVAHSTEAKDRDDVARPHIDLVHDSVGRDSRAEQRSGVDQVEARRNVIREVGPRKHVLAVTAVHVLAGDDPLVAELLAITCAELALATRPPDRLNANGVAQFKPCDPLADASDTAGRLVPWDDRADRGDTTVNPVALDGVKVGAAHAARHYLDEELARGRLGAVRFLPRERTLRERSRGEQEICAHRCHACALTAEAPMRISTFTS